MLLSAFCLSGCDSGWRLEPASLLRFPDQDLQILLGYQEAKLSPDPTSFHTLLDPQHVVSESELLPVVMLESDFLKSDYLVFAGPFKTDDCIFDSEMTQMSMLAGQLASFPDPL